MKKCIDSTIEYVKETLKEAEGGHDWQHIHRVYLNAKNIAETEAGCNRMVVELAALLHDIADSKFNEGDETIGPMKAAAFLNDIGVDNDIVEHVVRIIENISYKGGNFERTFDSIELRIVQDADRLDAIGAIGIARAFNYGGFKNRPIYDPNIEPRMKMTKEEYKNYSGPTINHFYEKLLLLKDLMNTEAGKRLAEERHRYMEGFLAQFYSEYEGLV